MEYTLEVYETPNGERPFSDWLRNLKDLEGGTKIRKKIDMVQLGNFGQWKRLENIIELKVDFGPGYRIYIGKIGKRCILLLCAGSKRTQEADIKTAKKYFEDFKERGKYA